MIDELNYAVGEAIDKLAAYEDAEEQDRLVILPCKGQREIKKLTTNADRIRAMTDLELADFLRKTRDGCRALTTESYVCDFYTDDLNTDCRGCWLDWLKQEAEEAEHDKR